MLVLLLAIALSVASFPVGGQGAQPAASAHKLSPSEIPQLRTKAEAGDAGAQLALAKAYEEGNGVAQSDEQAALWYRKAADLGNAEAQNNLGTSYWSGRGVERDKQEAVKWYLKSARQKYPPALFNVAVAYYNGEGVPAADNIKAYAWFLLAQEAGSQAATDGVQRLESGMKMGGVDEGLLTIAEMYENGEDVDQDYGEAAKWYRKAAEKGVLRAQVELARMLIRGQGIPQDFSGALHWCEVAANKDFLPGMYCVGTVYRDALGVPKDSANAFKWFQRAASHCHGDSMWELGKMYWNGYGVKKDKVVGYTWTLMAFSARVPDAREGALLMRGQMSDREREKAKSKAMDFLKRRPCFHLREPVPVTQTSTPN
jgi:TPR repeat protein